MAKSQYPLNQYFGVEDLVPKSIIDTYGAQCYRWVSPTALDMLTKFREFINLPMTINDWLNGGSWQYCGYRPPGCGVGATNGAHYRMIGFDVHVKGWGAKDYQNFINKAKTDKAYQKQLRALGITIIEEGTFDFAKNSGWIHISCEWVKWLPTDSIYFVPFK